MIALDTNILVRAIVAEANADTATLAQRERALRLLGSSRRFFVPLTVVQELEWVLRSAYDMPVADITAVLDDLLCVETMEIDRAAAVQQAIGGYRQGLDFSDALHLALSGLCESMASFDAGFDKRVARAGLKPPVVDPDKL